MRFLLLAVGLTTTSGCCCNEAPAPVAAAPDAPAAANVATEPRRSDRGLPSEPGVVATTGQETCITFGDVNGVGVETELAAGTEVLIIIPGGDKNVIVEATARGPCANDGSDTIRHRYAIHHPYVQLRKCVGLHC